jgi:hypothetical protein
MLLLLSCFQGIIPQKAVNRTLRQPSKRDCVLRLLTRLIIAAARADTLDSYELLTTALSI